MTSNLSRTDSSSAPLRLSSRENSGRNLWFLAIAVLSILAISVGVAMVGRTLLEPFVLTVLASLAIVGVFALFSWSVGIVNFTSIAMQLEPVRALADKLGDGFLLMDRRNRIRYANPAYQAFVGADCPEDVCTIERAFVGNTEVADAMFRLSQAMRERHPWTEVVRLERAADPASSRWFRIHVTPLDRDTLFNGEYTIWQMTDITRDRNRQQEVVRDLQKAIHYLDHAPVGFFSAKPDGRIDYLNATLCNWLGHDIIDVPEKHLTLAYLTTESGAALMGSHPPAAGKTITRSVELDLVKRNGQRLPVRLMHQVPYASDGTEGASRTVVINREIEQSDSRDAEGENLRLSRFFNAMPMAVATVDPQGCVREANAVFYAVMAKQLEHEPEHRTEQFNSMFALFETEAAEAINAALVAAINKQADIPPVEAKLTGPGNRSARLYFHPGDGANGAILFVLDTTEQKVLEAQFAQSQKMQAIGQLAGGVAHDFNNVLTAILGFSDLVLSTRTQGDQVYQDVMNIKQNANRAAGLVRQLLAFSRQQTLLPQVLVLSDVLHDLNNLLGRLLGERIKLTYREIDELWYVKVDINQFEQVIINLAVNARDAMEQGGELFLETRNVTETESALLAYPGLPPGEYVAVEVRDTGMGMSEDVLKKIFDPFFSTKEVGKGTGLGLSTVYGIIKQTGGFIYPESTPGKGSRFAIYLPRHVPSVEEQVALVQETVVPVRDLTGSGGILLVEDESAVRAFAERALRSKGYRVRTAESGREALEIMAEPNARIDLVISDVVMPEMDGPTLLKALRKDWPKLRIIFVSGYAEDAFRKNLPEDQEFYFLPKPFEFKRLISLVKEVMPAREDANS